jgi:hypothetical protein
MLPWLWVQGWIGTEVEWRGAAMSVGGELAARPVGPAAPG